MAWMPSVFAAVVLRAVRSFDARIDSVNEIFVSSMSFTVSVTPVADAVPDTLPGLP